MLLVVLVLVVVELATGRGSVRVFVGAASTIVMVKALAFRQSLVRQAAAAGLMRNKNVGGDDYNSGAWCEDDHQDDNRICAV